MPKQPLQSMEIYSMQTAEGILSGNLLRLHLGAFIVNECYLTSPYIFPEDDAPVWLRCTVNLPGWVWTAKYEQLNWAQGNSRTSSSFPD